MITRSAYFQRLRAFVDKPQIKILMGIRRSGKSTALLLLKEELLSRGVEFDQIIHINLESFTFSNLRVAAHFYTYVTKRIQKGKKTYLLLDEIQEVEQWEKAVNSMLVDFNVDIYLTGSNSHLLSSELATYLAGRYVEIAVYTLSFAEYLQFRATYFPDDKPDNKTAFMSYLRLGGFPVLHTADYSVETAYKVVYDIYSSVILRDTVQRYKIRDVELLERIVKYAFDNIGNTFSRKNVADYFKSQQRKIDLNTVYNYLNALEGAFILYRASRYDIKGRNPENSREILFERHGIAVCHYGLSGQNDFRDLENIVFLELKRRGYTVFVGKYLDKEIDFMAEKQGKKIYVQVAYKLESKQTIDFEFSTLLTVQDQFPKFGFYHELNGPLSTNR